MAQSILKVDSLLSSNTFNVSASAVQVSGSTTSANPYTSVNGTFVPAFNRARMILCNNSNGIIYIGSSNTVTNTSGYIAKLNPGEYFDEFSGGRVPRFLYGSASNLAVTMEEYN